VKKGSRIASFHAIFNRMIVEQIIEIPENRRITLDLPQTLPVGKARISIFPVAKTKAVVGEFEEDSFDEAMAAADKIIAKHIEAFKALAK